MNIKIRKASGRDLDALTRLNSLLLDHHHKIDPEYWNPGQKAEKEFRKLMAAELKRKDTITLICFDGNKPVGYFAGTLVKSRSNIRPAVTGYISNAYIAKEYRGQGLARKMLEEMFGWFKKRGARLIRVTADARNSAGLKIWKRLGFEEFRIEMKQKI